MKTESETILNKNNYAKFVEQSIDDLVSVGDKLRENAHDIDALEGTHFLSNGSISSQNLALTAQLNNYPRPQDGLIYPYEPTNAILLGGGQYSITPTNAYILKKYGVITSNISSYRSQFPLIDTADYTITTNSFHSKLENCLGSGGPWYAISANPTLSITINIDKTLIVDDTVNALFIDPLCLVSSVIVTDIYNNASTIMINKSSPFFVYLNNLNLSSITVNMTGTAVDANYNYGLLRLDAGFIQFSSSNNGCLITLTATDVGLINTGSLNILSASVYTRPTSSLTSTIDNTFTLNLQSGLMDIKWTGIKIIDHIIFKRG